MGANGQRPRFFEGQYLSAGDLSAVVDYLRSTTARHALGAGTWGIGIGLYFVEGPAPGAAGRREVILQPGWGRDGFGRHLVVQQPLRLAESLFAAIPYNAAVDSPALPGGPVGRLVKVWLGYTEAGGRAPAPGFEVCGVDNTFARVEEGVEFVVGEVPPTDARAPVVIGAETVDALDALTQFDAGAAPLYDTTVAQQRFPAGDKPPRWLLPLGLVRWIAGNGVLGYFIDRDHVAAAHAAEGARAFRRYVGAVAQNIEAAEAAIVLRKRSDKPDDAHRYAQQLASGQLLAALDEDLVWVEGGLRALGDLKLAGSRLLLRNPDGLDEGTALYLARSGDASGAAGLRELRAVIGGDAQTDNRFIVGPELAVPPPAATQIAPHLVVISSGRVGVGLRDPASALHVRGDAIRLEDTAAAKRIDMRTDGVGVELSSNSHSLHVQATGPAAQNGDRVIINPVSTSNGAVGIGTDDPQYGLDVNEPGVRFALDRGNGGHLALQGDPAPEARDRVYVEASVPAGGDPAPELRMTGPLQRNLPLFSAYADTTYLSGKLGVNQPTPAAQVHVLGTRIRLESVDGQRRVDLRADGSAVDLESTTSNLYLRSTGAGAPRHIVMNPDPGDGNVGVGLTAPTQKLHVHGQWLRVDGSNDEQTVLGGEGESAITLGSLNPAIQIANIRNLNVAWSDSNAAAWLNVWGRSFVQISDARAKTEVRPISGALAQIAQLRGVSYQWAAADARAQDGERLGLIAQEVQQVVPQAVVRGARGAGISYTSLVPLLIESVKELREQVQELQKQLKTLQGSAAGDNKPKARAAPKRRATKDAG